MKIQIPFKNHKYQGQVTIDISENDNPSKYGFDILTNSKQDLSNVNGFPVCEAIVSTFSGKGYHSYMGWIQFISYEINGKQYIEIDRAPMYQNVDSPFFSWGVTPTLLDAPAMLENDRSRKSKVKWAAEAFLVSSPNGLMDKSLLPIASFTWGYSISEDKKVRIYNPRNTKLENWSEYTELLNKEFPNWKPIEVK